jgi:hypothetical protein
VVSLPCLQRHHQPASQNILATLHYPAHLPSFLYRPVCRSMRKMPRAMLRRLEDRIRELCAKVITARGCEALQPIHSDLKSALHEHAERLRKTAALKLVRREDDAPPERRSA